jgi:Ala-tRNA(Pro) deacylase
LLGLPWIRLADEGELAELFPDCELGAMPPFGYSCELPVVVDARIAGDFIAFTIGTHRDVVRMSFADFSRLARPRVAFISVRPEVLV